KVTLPDAVAEVFPTRLPPLRSDSGTLVVGKLKAPVKQFDYAVTGVANGHEVEVKAGLKVPAAEVDNFFLVEMVAQWREAKDRPAALPADRALGQAFDRHQLAMGEVLQKANWLLDENQLDPAMKLFKQAQALDPHNKEAVAGQKIVEMMREG